jgi:hypothetical protein
LLSSPFSAARLSAGNAAASAPSPWLSTLTYRSRAVAPMSESDLYTLAQTAQARNRAEGITGVVIYDEGQFFQWLEGPEDGLARVWDSVSRDPRHTDIEVLGKEPTKTRFFGGWDMKVSSRSAGAPRSAATTKAADGSRSPVLALVKAMVVIPEVNPGQAIIQHSLPVVDPRAGELARLLTAADLGPAHDMIAEILAQAGPIAPLYASLFEPVARGLGDLWQTDDCSEFEVTLGLGQLQASLRQLGPDGLRITATGLPAVLVAPQPGEIHMLGAVLDAELMWQSGWDIHAEFPTTNGALQAMVANTWFDALDLSLSAAFRRDHWLPRMTETIAGARIASRNPKLIVVVGGRIFSEANGHNAEVGADMNCITTLQTMPAILRLRAQ